MGVNYKQKGLRYRSIDVLRACSLIEMVHAHFIDYLSPAENEYNYYEQWGFFGAPMFLFLSGICYHIGIESRLRLFSKNDVIDGKRIVRWKFVKRGACLCIVGAAMVATQFLKTALECDAIVTSGLTQIVLAVFFWEKSSKFLICACLSVILITPVIRGVATVDVYWDYENFEIRETEHYYTPLDVMKLHLVAGYFPLFPYASFSILGLLVGRVLVPRHSCSKDEDLNLRASKVRNISIFGAALFGIGKWLGRIKSDHAYLGGWTTYQLTFPSCIGKTGRVLMWFGMVSYAVDFCRHKTEKGAAATSLLDNIVGRYSKAPLTIYFVHNAAIFWPLRFCGWLSANDEWWEEASTVLEEWQASALGLFFIFFLYFLLGWLDHWRLPRIEHALQWLFVYCHC